MFEGYFEKILERCLKGILPRYWTDGGGGRERYWRGSKSQREGGGGGELRKTRRPRMTLRCHTHNDSTLRWAAM